MPAWAGAGVALLLGALALPTALLLRRSGALWSVSAGAPLLGLVGLAGAWPALAGQRAQLWQRAALGALGFWWLALTELLSGDRLALGAPPGAGPAAGLTGAAGTPSVADGWDGLTGLVSSGALGIAALWALAAALLPLLVRGRRLPADLVGATVWAAALGSATQAVAGALAWDGAAPTMRGLVLGAVAAGGLAVAAAASRGEAWSRSDS